MYVPYKKIPCSEMSTVKEIFAHMSPNETPQPVSVERSGAPDPMTAAVQTPICVCGSSTHTSMWEADARPTELARELVKRRGTLNPAPKEKNTPTEKKLKFWVSKCAKDGRCNLMFSNTGHSVDDAFYHDSTTSHVCTPTLLLGENANQTPNPMTDTTELMNDTHFTSYDPYDHLTAIHHLLPHTHDSKVTMPDDELVSLLDHIVWCDALRISDKDGSVDPADHCDFAFYRIQCLKPYADPESPFVRAVTLVEKEMEVRPRCSPVRLPSIASEQAKIKAASDKHERQLAEAHALRNAPAFQEWRSKLLKANGGFPPAPLLTLKVEFMRGTPIEKLVTYVSVTLLPEKHRHPGVFFVKFSDMPDKTYAVALPSSRRPGRIALVTGKRKAKLSNVIFKGDKQAAMVAFRRLGNTGGSNPFLASEVCLLAEVDGVSCCVSAAVGKTAVWATMSEQLNWAKNTSAPAQHAVDPETMTADDRKRIELVRKHVQEQNEAAARAAAAEREAAAAPVHVPTVAAPEPEPKPEPPVTAAQVAQALTRLREVVRCHMDYFQAKARNSKWDSGHKMCKAMKDINSDSQDKWVAAATFLGATLLLDRTPSGWNKHRVQITTTPEDEADIKLVCSLTPCFYHFRGTIDQSQRDDEGNCIPAFKPGVTLDDCHTPRCVCGERCPFAHDPKKLLKRRIEINRAWFCYHAGLSAIRDTLQKGDECLGFLPSDLEKAIDINDHVLRCAVRAETDARRTLADFLVPNSTQRSDRHARRPRSPVATGAVLELSAEDAATVRAVAMRAEEEPEDDARLFAEWEAECEDLDEAGLPVPSYDEWLNSRNLRAHTKKLLDAPRFTVGTHARPASKGRRGNRGSKDHLGTVNGFSAKPIRRRHGARK